MGLARRIGLAVATAALAVGAQALWAGDPPKQGAAPPADEKLLEFLGSIDSSADPTQPDDGSWLTYLSNIDIGKVAKASQAPPPARGRPKSASPAAGADKPSG